MSDRCIAVFGGSFDPPHVAHVMVAAWVLSATEADGLVIVPTWKHPFDKDHGAPYEHRVAMCEQAFSGIAHVDVSTIERDLAEPSRTLQTLEALRVVHPNARFRLVVGADVLPETDRWHRWDEVTRLAPPIVVGRRGYPLPEGCPIEMPEISSTHLRAALREALPVDGLIPAAVHAYVETHHLYRNS